MGIDYRGIDKHYAAARKEPEAPKRGHERPIAIYMQPFVNGGATKLHCLFCGNPFIEVRNNALYVSPYPADTIGRHAADEIICKRCKQRYVKIV